MTKAEILKKEILRQYRSVRQFAMEMNIPYSTEPGGFLFSGERCFSGSTASGKPCYAELREAEPDR